MRPNKAALLSVMAITSAIGGVNIPEPKPVKRKASKTYNTSQEQQRRARRMAKIKQKSEVADES